MVYLCRSRVDSLAHCFNGVYWKLFKVHNIQCITDIESPIYFR